MNLNKAEIASAPRMDNLGAVAMSKEAALNSLSSLEEILGSSKALADIKGLNDYYTRDVDFVEKSKFLFEAG